MKNKIIVHLTIVLILVGVFCNVCTTYNCISFYDSSVYAVADNWTSCDTSDLVTAFRYYCKSRNLALEGSVADALTSFTTSTFNNICSTLGIDPTQLQAELKKTTSGNLGLRFLFSQTGITAYNRIFSEFLQNNDLSVGDEIENKVLKSGEIYTDLDGNSCFVYQFSGNVNDTDYSYESVVHGSYLKYPTERLMNVDNYQFHVISGTVSEHYEKYLNVSVSQGSYNCYTSFTNAGTIRRNYGNVIYGNFPHSSGGTMYCRGYITVIHVGDGYYLGSVSNINYANINNKYTNPFYDVTARLFFDETSKISNGNVYITTNNNTINNNVYNNNYTIIYNDGDTYISDDDDEPLPTTPPSGGGGGGGGDNPDIPDFPPVDPTPTPNPTIPDWDIELPEMPTGNDWLLYGLEKKFPWDIPFNLMYMLSLFAADPETPHFEGTLDLKIVQWDYDIDLAPFDDIAGYVRNIEFIGFLIGLMLLTNKLIWG